MKDLNAPILITAYNRFKSFKRLVNSLKSYKCKIYISIDGPKNNFDRIQQKKIIDLIEKVKKNFNLRYRILGKNLGCQKAIFSSLDWFFSKEEKGIILEDDHLPSKNFFSFCNKLLIKFAKDKEVFSVSGYTPFNKTEINSDYFFSKIFMCWGWATWRSSWLTARKFTSKKKWPKLLKTKQWKLFLNDDLKRRYYNKVYNLILSDRIDSWAFLWQLIGAAHGSMFIIPKRNLVKNTGTQTQSTHFTPSNFDYTNFKTFNFDIKHHPKKNFYDTKLDLDFFYYSLRPKNQLYPWRIKFLIRSLFLDPKFFFTKVIIFLKKLVK